MQIAPFTVELKTSTEYQSLLNGVPHTKGLRSGKVSLLPGEDVGEHSTKDNEEVLVVLSGEGKVVCKGFQSLTINTRTIGYIPPFTIHNVINTGEKPLEYIYIVTPVRDENAR